VRFLVVSILVLMELPFRHERMPEVWF